VPASDRTELGHLRAVPNSGSQGISREYSAIWAVLGVFCCSSRHGMCDLALGYEY
jgi:hypothetical protein